MKQIISKILTIILLLNLAVCMNAGAQQEFCLYIDGAPVDTDVLVDDSGTWFLDINDLGRLALSSTVQESGIAVTDGVIQAEFFIETSIVLVDGKPYPADCAALAQNGNIRAVNLQLLCNIFGYAAYSDNGNVFVTVRRVAAAPAALNGAEKVVSGTVSTPRISYSAMTINLFLRETTYPYQIIATSQFQIPGGQESVPFSLAIPADYTGDVILGYKTVGDKVFDLYGNPLYDFGYYRSGTYATIDSSRASTLSLSESVTEISLELIWTRTDYVTIYMPDGQTAASDIKGNVYAVPNINFGTDDSFISTGSKVIIEQGKQYNQVTFRMPIQPDIEYKIGVRFLSGDDRIYNTAYYYDGESSTSSKYTATSIPYDVYRIQIPLLANRTLSGQVANAGRACEVYAIGQSDLSNPADINGSTFYTVAYSTSDDGNFQLNLPSDVTDYIIGVKYVNADMSYLQYYSAKGLTADVNQADILHVEGDTDGLTIDAQSAYDGKPVKLLGYSMPSGNRFAIGYKNTSKSAVSGVSAFAVFYDSSDRMLGVSKVKKDFAAEEAGTLTFSTASISGKNAAKVKVFVWDDTMNPVSEVKQIDWTVDSERYKGLVVNNKTVATDSANLFYACGALMTTKEVLAGALGLSVSTNGDSVTVSKNGTSVTLAKNSPVASVNGVTRVMDAVMTEINGVLAIPLEFVAQCFSYESYCNATSKVLYFTN